MTQRHIMHPHDHHTDKARPYRNRRARWTTPLLSLALLLALAAGAVVVRSVTHTQVHFDDGTVWVTSKQHRSAARFNVRVGQANGFIASETADFDIAQQGDIAMLDERTRAFGIDAATLDRSDPVRTGTELSMALGGRTLALLHRASGDAWIHDVDGIHDFSAQSTPHMTLGPGGMVTVDHRGTAYGIRPLDGAVFAMAPSDDRPRRIAVIDDAAKTRIDAFSVVGGTPVASVAGRILWPSGAADTQMDHVTLQRPPSDHRQNGWIVAAGTGSAFVLDLGRPDGGMRRMDGGDGSPAEPVSADGCVHGAWNQHADNYLRLCSATDDAAFVTMNGITPTSDVRLRANHRLVVLNDVATGTVWNPGESADAIALRWDGASAERESHDDPDRTADTDVYDYGTDCSDQAGLLGAEQDEFGVRPGTRRILDVLRNDRQTGCTPLRISAATVPEGSGIAVEVTRDGRRLQLDATDAEPGVVAIGYQIDDGGQGTASGTVRLHIAGDGNRAPVQTDVPPDIAVERRATYTTDALSMFTDPDGDAMTLVSARLRNTDQAAVTARPDGNLVFTAGSMASGRACVEVVASDGHATATGLMYFSISPEHTLPAVIDPVMVRTLPDAKTVIDLRPYVHGTSADAPRLSDIAPADGIDVAMNAGRMSLTVIAGDVGTHEIPVTITQGEVAATGIVRVDVEPRPDRPAKPIAVDDIAVLDADGTAIVEPLANDIDPSGGVLVATSVRCDADSDAKVSVVDGSRIYVTMPRPITAPTALAYTAANAAGTSRGMVTVLPAASTPATGAIAAPDIPVQVRTNGIATVDVLEHITGDDGTVALDPLVRHDKTFDGLAFVSGRTVRYRAGDDPGTYKVVYTVRNALGTAASGTITFIVRDVDAGDTAPPAPYDVEAQVSAGYSTRIPITLAGVADGEDVTLLGLGNTPPSLGRITETGADYLTYEAYPDALGTDRFTYAVEDSIGRRAQAEVRVGICADAPAPTVHAQDDAVTLRPGTTAEVTVTANDHGAPADGLAVTDIVDRQGVANVAARGDAIEFTTPDREGVAYVTYAVADRAGIADTATLTITVDPEAPIAPPTAFDYRVPPEATIDKRTVSVDVAPWIGNPSGPRSELEVGLAAPQADRADLGTGARSTTITIELTDRARAIPYTVTNTTHGLTSTAFIHVPAYGVFPPTRRPNPPELRVRARDTITIAVADHVRVGAGKTVRIDESAPVSATKAANDDLTVDEQTLRFTAVGGYTGPASITFTALDGRPSDDGRIINSSVITLPITVIDDGDAAPTFVSPTVEVACGESTVINLTSLTRTPFGGRADRAGYRYGGGLSSGPVKANVSTDGRLAIAVDRSATPESVVGVPISIDFGGGVVDAGVTVRVTPSSKPPPRAVDHAIAIASGQTHVIDMLSGAYNPFPDEPLHVVSCTGYDDAHLTVACDDDGMVAITGTGDDVPFSDTVVVTIRDATDSNRREAVGIIRVSVFTVPGAPLMAADAVRPDDGSATLSWTPGPTNGSPIVEYRIDWDEGRISCGTMTECRVDGLTNGRAYTFTVRARNAAGWSDASGAVTGTPDRTPPAPRDVQVQGGHRSATVTWRPPEYDGTPPEAYTVELIGSDGWTDEQRVGPDCSARFDIPDEAIVDGFTVSATVTAENRAGTGETSAPSPGATVWGDPASPTVDVEQTDDDHITLRVALGQLHNAGCRGITVSGAHAAALPCTPTNEVTWLIPRDQYWRPQSVTVTAEPERPAAAPASASAIITPIRGIAAPDHVEVEGSGATCTVRWRGVGEFDGFLIDLEGYPQRRAAADETHTSFRLSAWQRCGRAAVAQTLSGHTGPTASTTSDHVNAVPASLDGLWIEWADADTVTLRDYDFDTWGQRAEFALTVNGVTVPVHAGQFSVPLPGVPADAGGAYTWTFTVTGSHDPRLDNTATGTIRNRRPLLGDAPPTPFTTRPFASQPRSSSPFARTTSRKGDDHGHRHTNP